MKRSSARRRKTSVPVCSFGTRNVLAQGFENECPAVLDCDYMMLRQHERPTARALKKSFIPRNDRKGAAVLVGLPWAASSHRSLCLKCGEMCEEMFISIWSLSKMTATGSVNPHFFAALRIIMPSEIILADILLTRTFYKGVSHYIKLLSWRKGLNCAPKFQAHQGFSRRNVFKGFLTDNCNLAEKQITYVLTGSL